MRIVPVTLIFIVLCKIIFIEAVFFFKYFPHFQNDFLETTGIGLLQHVSNW